ncbi:MAG: DUF5668 domain-containing protein [Chloroflexota bacterium]
MTKHEFESKKGLVWPFILVTVGIAFLFQNLGLLETSLWNTLVQLWPILLIALGLNSILRHRNIVDPIFTIGIGLIFLAGNFGLLSWTSWMTVLRLWPVLLIAVGLEIFFGRKSILLSSLSVLLALSILVAGLWFSGAFSAIDGFTPAERALGTEVVTEQIEQPLEGADSAKVFINPSIGAISVGSLSSSDNLIEGTVRAGKNETIRQNFKQNDDGVTYSLDSDITLSPTFFNVDGSQYVWDLALNDETLLDLHINLEVGESNLDLSDLTISELDLNIGVGQVTVELPAGEYQTDIDGGVGQTVVYLPDEGNLRLDVDGGVGEIVIRVPEGMALKIFVDRGIAGLGIPHNYTQSGDVYTSPGYIDSEDQTILYVDQGVGNIAIREQ